MPVRNPRLVAGIWVGAKRRADGLTLDGPGNYPAFEPINPGRVSLCHEIVYLHESHPEVMAFRSAVAFIAQQATSPAPDISAIRARIESRRAARLIDPEFRRQVQTRHGADGAAMLAWVNA